MDKRVTNPLIEKNENPSDVSENSVRYSTSDGVVIHKGEEYIQVSKDDRLKNLYNSALEEINDYLLHSETAGITKRAYALDIDKANMTNPPKNGGNN